MKRSYLINMRRENGDLTQDEVSNRAGIKRQYYCSLEAGGKGNQITLVTAVNLCKALNVPLDDFIKHENEYKMKCERENKARKLKKAELIKKC